MRIFWRALLVAVAILLAWRVVTIGLARYYADQLIPGDIGSITRVLTWAPEHPEALFEQALITAADDPEQAQRFLARAYQADPTRALPLVELANELRTNGQLAEADPLIEIADRLDPVNPFVQKQIALYWDQRQNATLALRHLSTAMEADASERGQIFPVLLQIAEDPTQRELLKPFALAPPTWWDSFFSLAAQRARNSDTPRFLYNSRRQAPGQPITVAERTAYRKRLIKDGQISEAYLVWVNGLDNEQRRVLGLLYNGGFELPLSNQGFSWHSRPNRRVEITTLPTKEASGQRALRLNFRAFEGRFAQLWQPLFLDSGTYRLSGRMRSDNLDTQGGLRWQVHCLQPNGDLLGESSRFVGSNEWMRFSFDFEVTEQCLYQQLRLVSAGRRSFVLGIDGILWFDDMQIARTTALDAAARADVLLRETAPSAPTQPLPEPEPKTDAQATTGPAIHAKPSGADIGVDSGTSRIEEEEPPAQPASPETDLPAADPRPLSETENSEFSQEDDDDQAVAVNRILSPLSVELAFSGPSWVDIRDSSGQILLFGEMSAGNRKILEGTPPYRLVIGNASTVELTLAGEPYDLEPVSRGNVARFELDPERPNRQQPPEP
ncbi:MAG: DUF4115 domain-containing protein [Chromatiaceae bacterium]|nr:DUF4115 domain-containing protein [Chromatiaceae bacterium]